MPKSLTEQYAQGCRWILPQLLIFSDFEDPTVIGCRRQEDRTSMGQEQRVRTGASRAVMRNTAENMPCNFPVCEIQCFRGIPRAFLSQESKHSQPDSGEGINVFLFCGTVFRGCLFFIEDGRINLRNAEEKFERCLYKWYCKAFDGNCAKTIQTKQ